MIAVAYPAIGDSGIDALARQMQMPAPLQNGSTNRRSLQWLAEQVATRSPYFAAVLYDSLHKQLGDSVVLLPFFAREVGIYADSGLTNVPAMVVDTRIYSFGISAREAIEDQKHEALTMGPYLTTAVGVEFRDDIHGRVGKQIIYSPLSAFIPSSGLPRWSGGSPSASRIPVYQTTRIELPSAKWQTYLDSSGAGSNPAQTAWADGLARNLKGVYAKVASRQAVADIESKYAQGLFGNCAAEVASRFTPEVWTKLISLSMKQENNLLSTASTALYQQLISGIYGSNLRTQMSRETKAIERWKSAHAAQGLSNFMAVVTNVAAGASQSYGTYHPSSSVDLSSLQTKMFEYNNNYQTLNNAYNAQQRTAFSSLSALTSSVEAPALQAVTIMGADQQAHAVNSIPELRSYTSAAILNAAKIAQ